MLTTLKRFLQDKLQPAAQDSPDAQQHRARLAASALLVEIARADDQLSAAEREALLASLDRKFGLDADEAGQLIALAETESHQATDLYQFTSQINRTFDAQQKLRLVEELWRAAFADGALHSHEEHLIRRIADLIHVPHAAFIGSKLKVRGEQ